jgi:ADP-ribose pyrophosphatase YjhB (NUDIX family)
MKDTIRVLALCVFRNNGRILVFEGFDSVKNERFYRPLGGAVEFGETAADTLVREIREELQSEIEDVRLIGVLENLFTYETRPGHEVIFVFDARFRDAAVYGRESIEAYEPELAAEGKDCRLRAVWISEKGTGRTGWPVYPDGLLELLAVNPQ